MHWAFLFLVVFFVSGPAHAEPLPYSPETAAELEAEEQRLQAEKHLQSEPPDVVEARRWLESAAESGSVQAMGEVGWLYEQGLGVEPDVAKALEYYQSAYEAGENEYGLRIGWMHLRGIGLESDRAAAEAWFRRVIEERDDSAARLALASLMVSDARAGVRPERAARARDLLVRALEDGETDAAFYLAQMYMEGVGNLPADPERAVHYARIGAEAGHPEMQAWLAAVLARGELLPRDRVEAHKWASLAASGGNRTGEQLRQQIAAELSDAELREARRRALQWLNER
ncbi:tetratricopeptide repeat protein [Thioalkalivibrio sp.]|uniref:tetratricopeptide repeat protein n=1 Tax=Thioalkalivibrio sp. TaxID=2093813 RepID=UPI003975C43F